MAQTTWNAEGVYSINECKDHWLTETQKQTLGNFSIQGEISQSTQRITKEQYDNCFVDGLYNRAIEDFNYKNLYRNVKRRGCFSLPSCGAIYVSARWDDESGSWHFYIVAGVHRAVFLVNIGADLPVIISYQPKDFTTSDCQKAEAKIYTDEGYNLYKQQPDQAFKAAFVAEEEWAVEFGDRLDQLGLKVKNVGRKNGKTLTGYDNLKKVMDTCSLSAVKKATKYTLAELTDTEKAHSNFIGGLSFMLDKAAITLIDEHIKHAVNKAIVNTNFLKKTQHGFARENIALRFAKFYNDSAKRKRTNTIDLPDLCSVMKMDAVSVNTDPVIAFG